MNGPVTVILPHKPDEKVGEEVAGLYDGHLSVADITGLDAVQRNGGTVIALPSGDKPVCYVGIKRAGVATPDGTIPVLGDECMTWYAAYHLQWPTGEVNDD